MVCADQVAAELPVNPRRPRARRPPARALCRSRFLERRPSCFPRKIVTKAPYPQREPTPRHREGETIPESILLVDSLQKQEDAGASAVGWNRAEPGQVIGRGARARAASELLRASRRAPGRSSETVKELKCR